MKSVFLLTISFRPEVGGVETRLDQLCRALSGLGHRVQVFSYQPIITRQRGEACEVVDNIRIRRIWWFGGDLFHRLERRPVLQMLYLTPYLCARAALFLLFRRRQYDLIHAAGFNAALAARALHAVFRIPFVVTTHSTYNFVPGSRLAKGIEWILRGAKGVIAVSSESAEELARIGVERAKMVVNTTWVDLDVFRPMDDGRAMVRPGEGKAFTVIFVGRLKEVKGIRLLLDAARQMPDVRFVVVGTGDLDGEVATAAAVCGNLEFKGQQSSPDVARLMAAADVLVLPSSREGFPRTVAESLACGTPVIVPAMSGITTVLSDELAIPIQPSVETVKDAIREWQKRCAGDPMLRRKARAFAEKTFSGENVHQILRAYGWE